MNSFHHGMQHSASITGVADINVEELQLAAKNENPPSPFQSSYSNLSGEGARILFATDEWFAAADNLLKESPPHFDPDAYCEQGKVMDGWESRRRREAGHDWCVIKLKSRARLYGIEIDTAHFTGNQVPNISLEIADLDCSQETSMVLQFPGALQRLLHGCVQGTGTSPSEVQQADAASRQLPWRELLPKTPLRPGYEATRMHYFTLSTPLEGTHVRVNYFPDGGVARLRLWGDAIDSPSPKAGPAYSPIKTGRTCTVVSHSSDEPLPSAQPFEYPELSLLENGGLGLACSNKHYGEPWHLIQPTLGRDMGDGWETARHPERPSILVRHPETGLTDSPLSDWCILKLGQVANDGVARIILDTKHFRGNYPESVLVEGCLADDDEIADEDVEWFTLVPRGRMAPDSEHVYERTKNQVINGARPVSHVRVSIFPDGGVSRVRVYGAPGEKQ